MLERFSESINLGRTNHRHEPATPVELRPRSRDALFYFQALPFGTLMNRLRVMQGISGEEFSRRLGYTNSHGASHEVVRWRWGEAIPRASSVEKVINGLGLASDDPRSILLRQVAYDEQQKLLASSPDYRVYLPEDETIAKRPTFDGITIPGDELFYFREHRWNRLFLFIRSFNGLTQPDIAARFNKAFEGRKLNPGTVSRVEKGGGFNGKPLTSGVRQLVKDLLFVMGINVDQITFSSSDEFLLLADLLMQKLDEAIATKLPPEENSPSLFLFHRGDRRKEGE